MTTRWIPVIRVPLHLFNRAVRNLEICTPTRQRFSTQHSSGLKLKDCYLLLGVDWSATVVDVREAYLKLAKQYHPDCGKSTADALKFAQIEQAYRAVLEHVTNGAQTGPEVIDEEFEKEVFDIHHTAPQHRQYLEYEGVGFGSPSSRQRHYQQYRVQRASDRVIDHKTKQFGAQETSIAEPEKRAIRRSKYSKVIDRLVEDLIQEAMSKGEFKNLAGSGKPLKLEENPYLDSTTHRLNKVLIDSGFAPEWISLDKEIRQDVKTLRESLLLKRAKLGPSPLAQYASAKWTHHLQEFQDKLIILNKKINKFNMIVPILSKQKVHFSYEKEVERVTDYFNNRDCVEDSLESSSVQQEEGTQGTRAEHLTSRNSVTMTFLRRVVETCRTLFLKDFTECSNTSTKIERK